MLQRLTGTLPRAAKLMLVAGCCLLLPGCGNENYDCEFSGITYGVDPTLGPYIQGTATCYFTASSFGDDVVICNGRYYTNTGQLEGSCG